jgi:hypothetical protein
VCADILADSPEPASHVAASHTDLQGTVCNSHSVMVLQSAVPAVEVTNGSPTPGSDMNPGDDHLEFWNMGDTASMSDTSSISSGCSSVGSQGETTFGSTKHISCVSFEGATRL